MEINTTPHKEGRIEFESTLGEIVESSVLPERVAKHTDHIFDSLQTELNRIGANVAVETLIPEIESLFESHFHDGGTSSIAYQQDQQSLNGVAAATLSVLRQHDIPITSGEVADLFNEATDPEHVVEQFEGEIIASYVAGKQNNILFATPIGTYQFLLTEDGGEMPTVGKLKSMMDGPETSDMAVITELAEAITSPTIQQSRISKIKQQMDAMTGEFTPAPAPERFIDRYAATLPVLDETHEKAKSIIRRSHDGSGRKPSVTAAAALWIAAEATGDELQQKEIAAEANVSSVGIRQAIKSEPFEEV